MVLIYPLFKKFIKGTVKSWKIIRHRFDVAAGRRKINVMESDISLDTIK